MHLYLRESPRAIILATNSEDERKGCPKRALVFRAGSRSSAQAVVEFLPKEEVDLYSAVRLTSRAVHGCLGLISMSNDLFLAVVTSATSVGNISPSSPSPEIVSRITEVQFFCLNASTYDDLSLAADAIPSPYQLDATDTIMRDRDPYGAQPAASIYEHPCAPLVKILSSGTFYYANPHWDISSRLSVRLARQREYGNDVGVFDGRFVWNEYVVRSLMDLRERLDPKEREDLDRCQFIILAIQGFVGIFTIPLPAPPSSGTPTIATVALISRLGWKRAGTRFNTRGVDDDGNTANFVETETLFTTGQQCFSYAQIRGSIPLFWEQQGLQTFGQKIQITRPQQASQPAFDRHFAQLLEEYSGVHVINLLGTKENEAILTHALTQHLRALIGAGGGEHLGITNFDFHNAVRMAGHDSVYEIRRKPGVRDGIDRFGYTTADLALQEVVLAQKGIFRTNCLDCLDRTNFVQDILSRTALEEYLFQVRPEWASIGSLWTVHRELWAENGDALSRIYAGTGALNTSFTRTGKRTLGGLISDATKSVSRAYINNFQDKAKQVAIDTFLGNIMSQKAVTIYDPIHDSVRRALAERLPEYSSKKHCTIFTGTWNLNGRPPSESLIPWLFPRSSGAEPDIFALGFQEIVPLTAQQIVQTDPEKKRMWEKVILETLGNRPRKKSEYIILRSEQLVGTVLIILVKTELTAVIRNVEASTHKTGLRGMSGNKGAVAIRLEYHDTNFCFVTAHLAAGHINVEERNSDYRTIVNGLHFSKGKSIGSHDNVIWLADTNYRIDLDNESVRDLALRGELDTLLAADQLVRAMDSQAAFAGYQEGPLIFPPTYRYDLYSDQYDTSEKMRIPAWTDRILYRGLALDLIVYSRSELRGSDHRPVFAIFDAQILIVDQAKKQALRQLLLSSVISTAPGEKLDEKLAALTFNPGGEAEVELPPPSSDSSAWWEGPDHPDGVFTPPPLSQHNGSTNPFDSPQTGPSSLSTSPSSSDEELYKAAALPPPITPQRAKQPPPRPPKPASLSPPPSDRNV